MGEPICDIPEAARCLDCGYALRGLTELRCPECGRAFDPADAWTINTGRPMGRVARWWSRPPGKPLAMAAAAASLLLIVASSAPGGYSLPAFLGLVCWVVIVGAWCLRFVAGLLVARRYRQPAFAQRGTSRRWFFVPTLAVITLLLLLCNVPLWMTFWISRPALDRLAKRVMAAPNTAPRGGWVGLYHATRIELIPGGMQFTVSGAGFLSSGGFTYDPTGASCSGSHYEDMCGGWYRWVRPMPFFIMGRQRLHASSGTAFVIVAQTQLRCAERTATATYADAEPRACVCSPRRSAAFRG